MNYQVLFTPAIYITIHTYMINIYLLMNKVPIHGDTDSDWTETSQEFSVPVLSKNGAANKQFQPSVIQG